MTGNRTRTPPRHDGHAEAEFLAPVPCAAEPVTDDAVAQIHQAARGKPRTVNNICTAALIATAGAGKNLVDHASARAAIAEVTATD